MRMEIKFQGSLLNPIFRKEQRCHLRPLVQSNKINDAAWGAFSMMSREQWLISILDVARETADRKFQEEAWLSGRPSTSSPSEIYNQLFDDYSFDLFFETYSKGFSPSQLSSWIEFKLELESFEDKFPEFPNERVVFEDPDWQRVRQAATQFVAAFEQKQGRVLYGRPEIA